MATWETVIILHTRDEVYKLIKEIFVCRREKQIICWYNIWTTKKKKTISIYVMRMGWNVKRNEKKKETRCRIWTVFISLSLAFWLFSVCIEWIHFEYNKKWNLCRKRLYVFVSCCCCCWWPFFVHKICHCIQHKIRMLLLPYLFHILIFFFSSFLPLL